MRRVPACVAASLLLVACGNAPDGGLGPASPAPSSGLPAGPTATELAQFQARDPKDAARVISRFDYLLHYRLMQLTGIEEALGGEARAVAALQAVGAAYEQRMEALIPQPPRLVPMAFTGEGMASGVVGLGLAGFAGLLSGGAFTGSIGELSDQQLAELARKGPLKFGDKSGNAEIDIGADGSLDQTMAFDVDEGGLTGKVKLTMHVDACPDAQGKVALTMDVESSMSVSGKPGTGGFVRSQFTYERWLDDDARLISSDDGTVAQMHMEIGGSEGGGDKRMERTIRLDRGGGGSSVMNDWSGFNIFTDTPAVEKANELIQQSYAMLHLFAEMTLRGMGKGPAWESGRCVDLRVTSSPVKRNGIRPNTAFDLEAMPRARDDGSPAGGSVVATLDGGASLQPASGKVRADARYQYAGPEKKDEQASIAFEARSKRGVGRATLAFDTKEQHAYRISGMGDCPGPWRVCDVTKPFTFDVCGGTMTHTPGGARSGSHTFQHSGARGSGAYTLEGPPEEMTAIYTNTTCAMGRCFKTPNGKATWTRIDACE